MRVSSPKTSQSFWVIDEALELGMVVPVEPVIVKQNMHFCRSGEVHELAEARVEAMLGRYASRRGRAPHRAGFLESQR